MTPRPFLARSRGLWQAAALKNLKGFVALLVFCIFVAMLQARHLSKRYGTLEVLHDVSLDIPLRGVTAIVGASGAGKSTLLQILGTLLRPEYGGSVCYDGTSVWDLRGAELDRFRCCNIGFIFQNHRLLPEFTIRENAALPAMIAGEGRKAAMERASALLDKLGLGSRLDHRPGELSGGECQRAAVARALINDPMVVLADEPTGSLDSLNRERLHRLFFDLAEKQQRSFVVVTHDETLAADAHRTIHMADGRIVDTRGE